MKRWLVKLCIRIGLRQKACPICFKLSYSLIFHKCRKRVIGPNRLQMLMGPSHRGTFI